MHSILCAIQIFFNESNHQKRILLMIQKQAIHNSVIKHFKLYRFLILIKRMAVNVGMAAVASYCHNFIFTTMADRRKTEQWCGFEMLWWSKHLAHITTYTNNLLVRWSASASAFACEFHVNFAPDHLFWGHLIKSCGNHAITENANKLWRYSNIYIYSIRNKNQRFLARKRKNKRNSGSI